MAETRERDVPAAVEPAPAPPEPARKKLKFPTAFTVLAAVLLLVWLASFIVPAGAYKVDPNTDRPVAGSYRELRACSTVSGAALCVETAFNQRLKQLWIGPPNGLYGVENDRGFVGADAERFLYGSAQIFLFVLAVGAFITVTMKTGAIQTGIGRLALSFRNSGSVLIAILTLVFALGGMRRAVRSPVPRRIFGVHAIKTLLDQGVVVICAGGGGIPTCYADEPAPAGRRLRGVEAVIDKDIASALLADCGTPDQRAIRSATPAMLSAADFAAGSMGPKVRAACWFAERTGRFAAIGSIGDTHAVLSGEAGTRVALDAAGASAVGTA